MMTRNSKTIDEGQIRSLMDGWAKALSAKDVKGVMSVYDPEIMWFDLAPPLKYMGADAYRRNW
jgi:ketosteroid isomerase-like protein